MPDRIPPGSPAAATSKTKADQRRGSILLTGATGFIGRRIQNRLIAEGFRLRVLARAASARAGFLHPRAELVNGTLADPGALARGVAGTMAVINCAGSVRGLSWEDFEVANVSGVRQLCAAIDNLSAPPALLHLSSLAAVEPELSSYARSKREGEAVLAEFPQIAWTVFRPPAVYGPGETEMRGALAWARRGIVVVPGGDRRQRLSMLHVDDLVSAVLAWLANPPAHRHAVYTLDDGSAQGYDWNEFAAAVTRRSPVFVGLPRGLLDAVARLNEAVARRTGRPIMLSRGKVRELTHSRWVADNTAFSAASGWQPRIALAEGVSGLFES